MRSLWRLAAVVTFLACAAGAQSQTDGQTLRKWLDCDVSWIFSDATVGPDFLLKVSFHGTPVAGHRISLRKDREVVATARTNSQGNARFHAVPPGSYHADSPDGVLFPSGNLEIEVKAGRTPSEKVEVEWPASSIAVRNLRGRFGVSEQLDSPELPLRNASVELRDLRSARFIESALTDANGDFEFITKDSGLYALRLTLMKQGELGFEYRDLAIELDPAAKEPAIPEMKAIRSNCAGVQLFRENRLGGWEQQ